MSETPSPRPPEMLSPQPLGSPVKIQFSQGDEPRWYLPTFTETLKLMRWRILYFLPILLVAIGVLALLVFPGILFWQLLIWWKFILILVGLPIGAAINAAKHAIRFRTEPFCIHCGYGLTGLPEGHRCPECGNPIDLSTLEDYRRDPHWFIKRYQIRHSHPAAIPFESGPRKSPISKDGT